MDVCRECRVLSGRGLCDELITRPEESYRLWRVVVCDLETSDEEALAHWGACHAKNKQTNVGLWYFWMWRSICLASLKVTLSSEVALIVKVLIVSCPLLFYNCDMKTGNRSAS